MSDDETGKITLAVLSQQILTLTQETMSMRAEQRAMANAITEYRIIQSRQDTQLINLRDELENLNNRVNGWSVINSAGVVFAAVVGVIFGNRQP